MLPNFSIRVFITAFYKGIVPNLFRVLLLIATGLIVIGDTLIFIFSSFVKIIIKLIQEIQHIVYKFNLKVTNEIKQTTVKIRSIIKRIHLPQIKRHRYTKIKPTIKTASTLKIKVKYFILGIIITSCVLFYYLSYIFINSLPSPKLIGDVNFPVSTKLFDRNDKLLYEIYREQNRTPVKLDELPKYVLQSTIAIEDAGYYNHSGISIYGGILRAIKETAKTGNVQGGSTITQQLVKTALLTSKRTLSRKLKEAYLAIWAEQIYTKKQILEMYLNQIPYGGSAYGIEEAARTYFGKSANKLDIGEAAFLAGLPQAPSYYSPHTNPQLALKRRNEVLKAMNKQGYIDNKTYAKIKKEPLTVVPVKTFIRAPHFVFYVKSLLEEEYGIKTVEEGGLRVETTLDLDLQDKVEEILKEELDKISTLNVSNGGVLITIPSTGEVLVMVGSKNYYDKPYGAYNTTTALRQPGSSIKPILYSLALENGYTAASILDDSPITYTVVGSKPYSPVNYDGRFHGRIPLRVALASSYNVPAVKTLHSLSLSQFINHAEKMGITTWDSPQRYGLSLALGSAEVKITDMAVAYGVFANNGKKTPLRLITDTTDYRGIENEIKNDITQSVITPEVTFIINSILSDNNARISAFGPSSLLNIEGYDIAVKTGTSNNKKDNWTIGYTPKYLVAVWVGNNDGSPMHQTLASGVTGAAPIWNRVMRYLLEEYTLRDDFEVNLNAPFSIPKGIVIKKCYGGRDEYFIAGTQEDYCNKPYITPYPTMFETNIQF